jgi:gliding motility-associated-like protein
MKRIFLIPIFSLLTLFASSQDWLAGSSGNFVSEALDVVVDGSGNSVVTGYFSGQIHFNDISEQAASGFSDILVAKFDANGAMLWLKRFGGVQADRGQKLAIDNNDNIYLTGYYSGSMTMGATTLNSVGGSRDIFTAKLTPAGVVTWARSDGGSGEDTPFGLAVDTQGNAIVTGRFEGSATISSVPLTSQVNPLTGAPSFDIFIAKFSTAGASAWARQGSTRQDDTGIAVTCDNTNNVYVTGQYSDTLLFVGQTIFNQVNNAGYVSKLNANGDFQWFTKLGATQTYASAIRLNGSNELYTTGNFLGTMFIQSGAVTSQLTNPYIKKIFLIKLGTASGNHIWSRAQGSDSDVSSRGLTLDAANNIYICGDFRCNFDEYRDSTDTGLWNTVGFRDIFVSKFAPGGDMIWNKHSGGKKDDFCHALANGGADKPICAGSFELDLFIPTNVYNLTNSSSSPNNVVFNGSPMATVPWQFYRMLGDLSKNVFVGKMHDVTNPNYYYYQPPTSPFDSISPQLLPLQDTVEFCNAMYLNFQQHTEPIVGPDFNFYWSADNLDDNPYLYVAHTNELVTITSISLDACYTFQDSIFTIAHQSPPLPLMSDDHNYNDQQEPSYMNIQLCQPDTALVAFEDLCNQCTLQINLYANPYHTGTDTFAVYTPGDYNVVVTNEFGCTTQSVFAVINDTILDYDSIAPQILMIDAAGIGDSITICENGTIQYIVIDTLTNPNGDPIIYNEPFISEQFFSPDIQTNQNSGPHSCTIEPETTGWYSITYHAEIGYLNACGVDTIVYHLTDSFHITVNPNPAAGITLTSDSPLCPGDSGYVSVSQTMPGGEWAVNSNIVWESADGDSIHVSAPGYYAYLGTITDSVTGCETDFSMGTFVSNKIPPQIQMYPFDGLICPNSTITLYVTEPGLYEWIGPDGSVLGTGESLEVSQPGLYSCNYTDPESCGFFLDQVEITEYITPFIAYSPVNIFCEEGEIELIPVYNGVADVNWLAPINSTENTVVITEPGTYYCEIFQCGTMTLDSVQIFDAQFTPTITTTDLLICPNGTVTLTTNPGMISYEWNEGEFSSVNTYTVTAPGTYDVTMINALGCEESISITIGAHNVPPLPAIADQVVCQGSTVTLTNNSGYTTDWYANLADSVPELTGTTYTIPNIQQGTTIYVSHPHPDCPFAFEDVQISVIDLLAPAPINGDPVLCEGEALHLETVEDPSYTIAWIYDNDTLSETATLNLPYSAFPQSGTIWLNIANSCDVATSSVQLVLVPEYTLQLSAEIVEVCDYVPVSISGAGGFSGQIYWINGTDSLEGNPLTIVAPLEDSLFTAYGIDDNGCVTLPASAIVLFEDCTPKIPNVITSNGDGTNDYFLIPNAELMKGNYLIILNRWGNVIYEMENYDNTFQGQEFSEGVYFYQFFPDGKEGVRDPLHGFFHLYRE